jgi:hypothetical protein
MESKINTLFETNGAIFSDPERFKKAFCEFVRHMKLRFINHYDILVNSMKYNEIMSTETCPNPVLLRRAFVGEAKKNHYGLQLRRQISMESGVTSAHAVETAFHTDTTNESSGLSLKEYKHVYKLLFQFFEFNYTIQTYNDLLLLLYTTPNENVRAIFISAVWFHLGVFKGYHACAFVRCDEKYFFYDDNFGLFPIDIPGFDFNFIMNRGVDNVSGVFLNVQDGKCCFYHGDFDEKKKKLEPLSLYVDNTWMTLITKEELEHLKPYTYGLHFTLFSCITETPTTKGGRTYKRRTKRTRQSRRKRLEAFGKN